MRSLISGAFLVGTFLWLSACDQAPGLPEPPGRAPVLSNLQITPDSVRLENVPPGQIVGDTARVPVTVSVTATDAEGPVEEVVLLVQRVDGGLTPLLTASLQNAGGTRFSATVTMKLARGATGVYGFVVFARDQQGRTGEAQGKLTFLAAGGPPVVQSGEASPNPFRPPGVLRLTAVVTDPDGPQNILRVEVQAPNGEAFQMFDDGRTSGDPVANDGRFTASFAIPEGGAAPGVQRFLLRAFDRAGNRSADVPLDVTVQ